LVECVIGFSDRGAKIALLQRSGPDADGYLDRLATDLGCQPSKRRADTFSDTPAFSHIDSGQDGGEFLPAIPRDEIPRPHRIAQKIGKSQQHLIATGMAKPFIDARSLQIPHDFAGAASGSFRASGLRGCLGGQKRVGLADDGQVSLPRRLQ
jgi:hypothetical protein